MSKKEDNVNVTVVLPRAMVEWLDTKVAIDDTNRSIEVRKIVRKAKETEERVEQNG